MKRFTEPQQQEARAPLPPAFSRLSVRRLSALPEAAPAGPYFGPTGPAPRVRKRGADRAAGAAAGAGGQQVAEDGAMSGAAREQAAPAAVRVRDRTAAHGTPLPAEPDDGWMPAQQPSDEIAGDRTRDQGG